MFQGGPNKVAVDNPVVADEDDPEYYLHTHEVEEDVVKTQGDEGPCWVRRALKRLEDMVPQTKTSNAKMVSTPSRTRVLESSWQPCHKPHVEKDVPWGLEVQCRRVCFRRFLALRIVDGAASSRELAAARQ